MVMPAATKRWTLEELHSLPYDGNKYELIHRELCVTPPPSPGHDITIARLTALLIPYVVRHALGLVFHPRSVIRWRGSEAEPDLMVRRPPIEEMERDEAVRPKVARSDRRTMRDRFAAAIFSAEHHLASRFWICARRVLASATRG